MRARMTGGLLSILVGVGVAVLTACGGPAGPTTAAPSAQAAPGATVAASPEDQRTSAASVAAGLNNIQGIVGQIAATAGRDNTKAAQLREQIEPQWLRIEGTIRANDSDAYLAFEDAFGVLEGAVKNGDAAAAAKGSESATTTAKAYLDKYPG